MNQFQAEYPEAVHALAEAAADLPGVARYSHDGWCNNGAPSWTSSNGVPVICQQCLVHAQHEARDRLAESYPSHRVCVRDLVLSGQAETYLARHVCPLGRPVALKNWDRHVAKALSYHLLAPFNESLERTLQRSMGWQRPHPTQDLKKLAEELALTAQS